jgi:hypothetical protein
MESPPVGGNGCIRSTFLTALNVESIMIINWFRIEVAASSASVNEKASRDYWNRQASNALEIRVRAIDLECSESHFIAT